MGTHPKRILITGGGSAGHVTPNLALIPKLKARGYEIHYVGRQSGIETDLIAATDIPYHAISSGKLRRYFDLQNVTDLFAILYGFFQAVWLVRALKPQVVFSKGGFVSTPVVWAAWLNRVSVIIHESDMTIGLANRLSIPFANYICYNFPETQAQLPRDKAVHTGLPIRDTLFTGDAATGKHLCGFADHKPVVVVMGGSLGSHAINTAVRAALDALLLQFHICHLCGSGGVDPNLAAISGYQQFEYVDQDLPHLLAMADVVVSRAGATALFELLAIKKPNLLIPLPRRASRGDQILNAQSFEKQGFSAVLPEEELSADRLITELQTTYQYRQHQIDAMASCGPTNGANSIIDLIEKELASQ